MENLCPRCGERPRRKHSTYCQKCMSQATVDSRRKSRNRATYLASETARIEELNGQVERSLEGLKGLPMSIEQKLFLGQLEGALTNLNLVIGRLIEKI